MRRPTALRPASSGLAASMLLCISFWIGASASRPAEAQASGPDQEVSTMTRHASGTFDVKLTPQEPIEGYESPTMMRMLIDKQLQGDLDGTSQGEMLGVRTAVEGSAGYVAMETVTGALEGRQGTFVLQHSSTMTRGEPAQSITVVPDSATGELEGLAGSMIIKIEDGQHLYELEYTLPEQG